MARAAARAHGPDCDLANHLQGRLFGLLEIRLYSAAKLNAHNEAPAAMAEDFENKNVGLVAAVIGIVIFLIGALGIVYNL